MQTRPSDHAVAFIDPTKHLSTIELALLSEFIDHQRHDQPPHLPVKIRKSSTTFPFYKDNIHYKLTHSLFRIDPKTYLIVGKKLGQGSYGKVREITLQYERSNNELVLQNTPIPIVIKTIIVPEDRRHRNAEIIAIKEADIAATIGLDPIATHLTLDDRDKTVKAYVMLSHQGNMNLKKYLLTHTVSLYERLRIIEKILIELRRIHSYGYSYTDLKPENIMYDGTNLKFVDWYSARKNDEKRWGRTKILSRDDIPNPTMCESYALAGCVALILQWNGQEVHHYKYLSLFSQESQYDFSELENAYSTSSIGSIINEIKRMGHIDPAVRQAAFCQSYSILANCILRSLNDQQLLHYRDGSGRTALYTALFNGNMNLADDLLLLGLDPFSKDQTHTTAISQIVQSNDLMERLISCPGFQRHINKEVDSSGTLLHHVIMRHDYDFAIKLIVAHGANLKQARCKDGLTPLDCFFLHHTKTSASICFINNLISLGYTPNTITELMSFETNRDNSNASARSSSTEERPSHLIQHSFLNPNNNPNKRRNVEHKAPVNFQLSPTAKQ